MPGYSRDQVGRKTLRAVLSKPSNTTGDAQVSYAPQATVWASLEELGGADRAGIVADAAARIVVWYRTDVTPRWRVEIGTRTWDVVSVSDRDGRKVELELLCVELKEGGLNQ